LCSARSNSPSRFGSNSTSVPHRQRRICKRGDCAKCITCWGSLSSGASIEPPQNERIADLSKAQWASISGPALRELTLNIVTLASILALRVGSIWHSCYAISSPAFNSSLPQSGLAPPQSVLFPLRRNLQGRAELSRSLRIILVDSFNPRLNLDKLVSDLDRNVDCKRCCAAGCQICSWNRFARKASSS
jgi:hypothetical protein